jgi:TRAP-type C4-dicarboxylate transport system permease small subunit
MAAFALVVVGLVIAVIQGGVSHGSLTGGIIAACGAIPACYGMWKGIQQETQGTLAISVGAVLVALAAGGLLIVLRVVDWLR